VGLSPLFLMAAISFLAPYMSERNLEDQFVAQKESRGQVFE